MVSNYLNIMTELCNITGDHIKNYIYCNEDTKKENVILLTNRLYDMITNKVDDIDFGTIPNSRGDITKIDNYENLVECVSVISALISEYKQPTDLIDTVSTAIENLKEFKESFIKSFNLGIEYPMILYNTMTLSVVTSVTLLIHTCIEYVKNGDDTIEMAFDKAAYIKQKNHVLFRSLKDFNLATSKGETAKLIDACIKTNLVAAKENARLEESRSLNEFVDVAVVSIGMVVFALMNAGFLVSRVVYLLKNAVYYFYYHKQGISDYFNAQAEFLQVNAENLQYRDKFRNDPKELKKVYTKQMVWVNRFRKWSNAFMIDDVKAQRAAEAEERKEKTQDRRTEEPNGRNSDDDLF